jgi:hypothetical protein
MGFQSFKRRTPKPEVPTGPPRPRRIAHQRQWSLTEYVCTAGPHDRPFEERHDRVSVALVTAGMFRYRTNTGEGMLYPGAFLLGNAGACYECGHEHSHGDRCLALHIDRELFAEIASGSSGSNRCEFRCAMLPAVSELASISVSLQQASSPESQLALEETVLSAIGTVVCAVGTNHTVARSGWGAPPGRPLTPTTNDSAPIRHSPPRFLRFLRGRRTGGLRFTPQCLLMADSASSPSNCQQTSASGKSRPCSRRIRAAASEQRYCEFSHKRALTPYSASDRAFLSTKTHLPPPRAGEDLGENHPWHKRWPVLWPHECHDLSVVRRREIQQFGRAGLLLGGSGEASRILVADWAA